MIRLNLDRLNKIYPNAYFNLAWGCAEPDYDDKPVLLADWNHVPNVVFDRLENLGFMCEWQDEWATCSECGKAIRTQPDSYSWQPAYEVGEGELLCLECLNPEEHYAKCENCPTKAITTQIAFRYPPEDYGYTLVADNYESGFWRSDNPREILTEAQAKTPGRYVFIMTDQGQFSVGFALYRYVG